MNALQSMLDWFHRPFKTPMDPWSIFLLVGVVMIAFILWTRVLAHLNLE